MKTYKPFIRFERDFDADVYELIIPTRYLIETKFPRLTIAYWLIKMALKQLLQR